MKDFDKESYYPFLSLPKSLYDLNLIFESPREIRIKKRNLELIVIFIDVNSFKNWSKNADIVRN